MKHPAKYRHIVSAANELFWKHGIKRVTVEEICGSAKVSKVTFYKYFLNKTDLAKEILKQLIEPSIIDYKKIIDSDRPFEEKLARILEMKLAGIKGVSNEFIADIYGNPELGLIEFMQSYVQQSIDLTMQFLLKGQEVGDINKDIKMEFIIYYFNKMMEMINDTKLIEIYKTPEELVMQLTNFFFYGIGAKK